MPDITMCLNSDCELRFKCFRFIAKPSHYQSYAAFKVVNGECVNYWPIK